MIQELIDFNLRRGTLHVRSEVRSLLCLLTKDNRRGTEEMNNIIMTRISAAVKGHLSNPDLVSKIVILLPVLNFSISK
jgi:E3 ubiquitin-protein ligase UBR4